ncbi:MAG: ferredoxin, partial [Deltaproteobacteria bacterium]|nr:ferredoxin [Deltaproteobacteria bacterium]
MKTPPTLRHFHITEDCINCGACAVVAEDFFDEDEAAGHYVLLQQPTSEEDIALCDEARESCPVEAIISEEVPVATSATSDTSPPITASVAEASPLKPPLAESEALDSDASEAHEAITADAKIRPTFERFPDLKAAMFGLAPIFKRLNNRVLWNTVARFATFRDAARLSKVSLCEILHTLNEAHGTLSLLETAFPECIHGKGVPEAETTIASWDETGATILDLRDREASWSEKAVHAIETLTPGEKLIVKATFEMRPLLALAKDRNLTSACRREGTDTLHFFHRPETHDWREERHAYEKLDLRGMMSDPFDAIMKKAYSIPSGSGFILIQTFVPSPLINMLASMDFDAETEEHGPQETWVYFHKKEPESVHKATSGSTKKVPVVIQSATPVGYPVIMRLLQAPRIREQLDIQDLKVWEETEKHLGWIVSGKADISFSAVITSSKLVNHDVVMPAVFVWDNFYLLTRGYEATELRDLLGHTIHAPLFREAPPAAITRYLLRKAGLDEDAFDFKYGDPFGRPEEILRDFLLGRSDTVLLREPEVSFALAGLPSGETHSILSYNDLWNRANPGYGSFPNAGLLLKGSFLRDHPDVAAM